MIIYRLINRVFFAALNFLKVVTSAEKYQNVPLIAKCKNMMVSQLQHYKSQAERERQMIQQLPMALRSLEIIAKAQHLGYDDVLQQGINMLSRYSSRIYTQPFWKVGTQAQTTGGFSFGSSPCVQQTTSPFGATSSTDLFENNQPVEPKETFNETQKKCVIKFEQLPVAVQLSVRKERLKRIEQDTFIS